MGVLRGVSPPHSDSSSKAALSSVHSSPPTPPKDAQPNSIAELRDKHVKVLEALRKSRKPGGAGSEVVKFRQMSEPLMMRRERSSGMPHKEQNGGSATPRSEGTNDSSAAVSTDETALLVVKTMAAQTARQQQQVLDTIAEWRADTDRQLQELRGFVQAHAKDIAALEVQVKRTTRRFSLFKVAICVAAMAFLLTLGVDFGRQRVVGLHGSHSGYAAQSGPRSPSRKKWSLFRRAEAKSGQRRRLLR